VSEMSDLSIECEADISVPKICECLNGNGPNMVALFLEELFCDYDTDDLIALDRKLVDFNTREKLKQFIKLGE